MELTELEQKLMVTIPKENFYEHGFESVLWNDCFLDTLCRLQGESNKVWRGVLSSLGQKGYLQVEGGKDGCLSLSKKGIEWLKSNMNLDEEGYEIITNGGIRDE